MGASINNSRLRREQRTVPPTWSKVEEATLNTRLRDTIQHVLQASALQRGETRLTIVPHARAGGVMELRTCACVWGDYLQTARRARSGRWAKLKVSLEDEVSEVSAILNSCRRKKKNPHGGLFYSSGICWCPKASNMTAIIISAVFFSSFSLSNAPNVTHMQDKRLCCCQVGASLALRVLYLRHDFFIILKPNWVVYSE